MTELPFAETLTDAFTGIANEPIHLVNGLSVPPTPPQNSIRPRLKESSVKRRLDFTDSESHH